MNPVALRKKSHIAISFYKIKSGNRSTGVKKEKKWLFLPEKIFQKQDVFASTERGNSSTPSGLIFFSEKVGPPYI